MKLYTQELRDFQPTTKPPVHVDQLQALLQEPGAAVFQAVGAGADPTIQALAQQWQQWEHVVCLGMGGSYTPPFVLEAFAARLPGSQPVLHCVENVDPLKLHNLTTHLPLAKTGVVVVSKSGSTLETLLQTALFTEAMQQQELDLGQHLLGITETTANPLRDFLTQVGAPCLEHRSDIGGRYSIFHTHGQFFGYLLGLDMAAMLMGADQIVQEFMADIEQHPATLAAQALVGHHLTGKALNIFNPYGDQLAGLATWYAQLWAESIGKDGHGSTPLGTVGTNSQHSLLQLMLAGPADKAVTMIVANTQGEGPAVSEASAKTFRNPLLAGLQPGTVLQACGEGTAQALINRQVPVRMITLPLLTEKVLGGVLMHCMLETAVACALLDVNPFDQPAVEESKTRTLAILQR